VLIDANDNLFDKSSQLPGFLANTNMTTLIKNPLHHPATHMRGTKCIDYILGSESLLPGIQQSGITPFLSVTCKNSDHRSLFIDIDQVHLLGANMRSQIPKTSK
jgi:hypothetical protein